jgi:hypothetical protein
MLDQNVALILSASIGGTLTIIGGLIVAYITYIISKTNDKNKMIREKIEEIFTLIDDVRNLSLT